MATIGQKPLLSVIIPMYNEEANVASTIARVEETLKHWEGPYEIIPVNDGSTDHTLQVLDAMGAHDERIKVVSYWKNGGRGKALRYGFHAATGEYIVTIDADLSYDPQYILDMAKVLEEESDIDMVLASAYMEGGQTKGVPADRLFYSKVGNRILQMAIPEKIHTVTCIVRCYRRAVIQSLDLESNGKEIHLEILSKAIAMGFRIKEIPATLTGRQKGSSKFTLRATAVSHLLFTVFERPVLLFGIIGLLLALIGLGLGAYIVMLYAQAALSPGRPLLTLMVLFILGGIQILSFGFLAAQIKYLRNEVLRVRRAISHLAPEQGKGAATGNSSRLGV